MAAAEFEISAEQIREWHAAIRFGVNLAGSCLDTDDLRRDYVHVHPAVVIPFRGNDLPRLTSLAGKIECLLFLHPSDKGVVRHSIRAWLNEFGIDQSERLAGEWSPLARQGDGAGIVVVIRSAGV